MVQYGTSRRNWLKAMGMGVGAILGSRWGGADAAWGAQELGAAGATSVAGGGDGILRVAHITDVHVQPERGGGRGMAACLRHIHSRKDRPSLILNTGDCIMDSFRHDRARTDLQWDLWKRVLRDECSLPVKSCLGNHDIWGWKKQESGTTGAEPLWGKKMGMEMLGLERPYHSFDHGAWHFILLDSVAPLGDDNYYAKLDEEQFAWLESDLKATDPKRPVLVGSHIPIFSPSALIRSGVEDPALPGRFVGNGGGSHTDIQRIGRLFEQHPNVKLCISGHLHQVDRAEYRGVTYISNPAVCGGWWGGPVAGVGVWDERYTMLALHPDGRFDVEHVDYGWVPEPKPEEKPAA